MNNNKTVVHLIKSANPDGGGAQRIVHGIKNNSHHKHIIIFSKKNNISINTMSTHPLLIPLKLIKTLIQENVSAVVIHDRPFLALHYIVKLFNKKTVFLCHSIFQNKNLVFKLLNKISYIAVSNSAQKKLISVGIPQEKISVIRNGILPPSYTENFSDLAKETNYIYSSDHQDHINIIYVGRLSTEKGIFTLIESLNSATLNNKEVKLTLIGTPTLKFKSEFENLDRKIKSKIDLTGNIDKPFEHIHNYQPTLIVIPSHYEGFGLVMAEALSAGLKIVATDIEPFREISSSPTITYCQPNSPENLARAIVKSLESKPSIQDAWSESKRIATEFSQKTMYRNYDHYFSET